MKIFGFLVAGATVVALAGCGSVVAPAAQVGPTIVVVSPSPLDLPSPVASPSTVPVVAPVDFTACTARLNQGHWSASMWSGSLTFCKAAYPYDNAVVSSPLLVSPKP